MICVEASPGEVDAAEVSHRGHYAMTVLPGSYQRYAGSGTQGRDLTQSRLYHGHSVGLRHDFVDEYAHFLREPDLG